MADNAVVTVAGTFDLCNTNGGTTTNPNNRVTLNGGTLTINNFINTNGTAARMSFIDFNGGLIKANSAGSFLPAFNGLTASVQAGGAKIDDNGNYGVMIDQPLVHDATTGARQSTAV